MPDGPSKQDIKALTAAINKLSGKAGGGSGGNVDPGSIERSADAAKAMADATNEALGYAERLAALEKAMAQSAGDLLDSKKQERDIANMQHKAELLKRKYTLESLHNSQLSLTQAQMTMDAHEENLRILKDQLTAAVKYNEEVQAAAKASPEMKAAAAAHLATLVHMNSEAEKSGDIYERQVQDLEDALDANGEIVNDTETLLNMLNLSSTAWEDSFFGRAEKMGFGKAMKAQTEVVMNALKPHNLFAKLMGDIFEQTIMMVKALDQALASFNKTTGAAGEMDAVFHETRSITASVGGNLETVSESITALYTGMTTFSNATKQTQTDLARFTVTMERAGVATDTTAALLDSMVSSLGMMTDEAKTSMTDMAMFADQVNMPLGQVMDNLQASMPILAKYGKDAIKVFKGVQAAAKATGIATQELLAITEQFDTFESAAESAGRLNAILGGNYLNSLQMVNMSEEERIRALLGVVDASGRSWDSMSKHEKQAIAAAAGIRDMDQANRLFGSGLAGYDAMLAKQEENAEAQERLAEIAKKAQSVFEKFTAIMEQLAIAVGPIINLLHGFMDIVMALNEATGGAFVPVLITLIGAYWLLSSALTGSISKIWANFAANLAVIKTWAMKTFMIEGTTAATWKQIFALNAMGGAMIRAFGVIGLLIGAYMLFKDELGPIGKLLFFVAGAMLAYGAATKFAGGWKMALVTAVLALITAFVEPHSPPFYQLVFIIAAGLFLIGKAALAATPGISALGSAGYAAGPGLMVLGVGLLVVGAGMFVIAVAIALVVASIALLVFAMVDLIAAFAEGGEKLLPFALALPMIALFGFGAMAGLIAFAIGMAALGLSLLTVKTDDLQALATMFEGMGKSAEASGGGMETLVSFLDILQEVADDVDEDTLTALSSMFSDLALLSEMPDMTPLNTFMATLGTTDAKSIRDMSSGLLELGNALFLFSLATLFIPNTLKDLEIEKLLALAEFFEKVGDVAVDQVANLAGAIDQLSKSLNNMPAFAPLTVAMMFESLNDIGPDAPAALDKLNRVMVTTSEIDDAQASKIEKVTKSITNMVIELQGGLFTNTEAVKETLESLAKILGGQAAKGGKTGENKIILALDRDGQKKIAEAMLPHLETLLSKKYTTARVRQG